MKATIIGANSYIARNMIHTFGSNLFVKEGRQWR